MAEQQEPIRRRVALKIIKLGMDTKQVIEIGFDWVCFCWFIVHSYLLIILC